MQTKQEIREYQREYYKKNRTRLTNRWREYYKKNETHIIGKQRKYYEERKEQLLAYSKAYYRANHKRLKEKMYSMEEGEFDRRFEEQGGRCKLCGKPLESDITIDHDHETGLVRGLIHSRCNWIIGAAWDDPEILRHAIDYLERT